MSHALEAETLRAIGADEWPRLQQFINAGLDKKNIYHCQPIFIGMVTRHERHSLHTKPH